MTRTVYGVGPWAVKVPWGWGGKKPGALTRGWLANRSEWKLRCRRDTQAPLLTVGFVINVYPVAESLVRDRYFWEEHVRPFLSLCGYSDEESKDSSWGLFGGRWLLLDYDRAWQGANRGWVGGWYYGRQERMARKWRRPPNSGPAAAPAMAQSIPKLRHNRRCTTSFPAAYESRDSGEYIGIGGEATVSRGGWTSSPISCCLPRQYGTLDLDS